MTTRAPAVLKSNLMQKSRRELQQCWWSKVQPPCRLWQRHTPWKSQWRRWISSPAAAKQQLSTGKKPLPLIILLHLTDILYISQLYRTYICTNQGLASWKPHRVFTAPVSRVHLLGQRGPTILQVDLSLDDSADGDVGDDNNEVVLNTSTMIWPWRVCWWWHWWHHWWWHHWWRQQHWRK